MSYTSNYSEYIALLKANKNLILTGAPGTGKTYLARKIAEAMNAEFDFVQFHPSYDYTDFVEGLRPTAPDCNGNIGFERKDGVFKEFCKKAITETNSSANGNKNIPIEPEHIEENKFYVQQNATFDSMYDVLKKRIQEKSVTLYTVYPRTPMDVCVIGNDIMYKKGGYYTSNYINRDYVQKLYNHYNGRGVHDITRESFSDFTSIIGNTLNYTYYRGIVQELLNMSQPHKEESVINMDDYSHKDILPVLDSQARKIEDTKVSSNDEKTNTLFIFIIDEINRGEISKIFGELFFSIDPGYRGEKGKVKTQYQNLITDPNDPFIDGFYVPENVYIIGTMNDIDRSVESMDFAMRRRFAWKEIKANENTGMLDDLGELKAEVVEKMNSLNNAIWNEETDKGIDGLNAAYHIGGAYFMKLKHYLNDNHSNKEEAYRQLWNNHLRGLLFEYLRGSVGAAENMTTLEKAYFNDTANA